MPLDVFALLRGGLMEAGTRMINDLEALPDDKVAESPGGSARSAADFVYEVAFVNRRVAVRLTGVAPPPVEFDGWMMAPPEFRNKAKLKQELQESVDALLDALDSHAPDGIDHLVPMPQAEWSVFETVTFVTRHMNYHDAQLNYLQALYGDAEMHW